MATRDELVGGIELGIRQVIALAILFNYEVAEKAGMNARDSQVLGLVQMHGPLTPGQIATMASLPSGTVTGVVDRLEAAGLVTRERDPDDRRKVIVTVDNERLARDLMPQYAEQSARLRAVLADYDDRKLRVISDFLTKVIAAQPGQEGG
ncbi:MAG: MarR family transcriptional regulator [Actinomycetota bacterium]|nr:MarR family transcriptional regulator [Actinomycetota bacterium]